MATKQCPRCKLINPGTTTACDCGWSFVERRMGVPRPRSEHELAIARENARQTRAAQLLAIGVAMLALGVVVLGVDVPGMLGLRDAWSIDTIEGAGVGIALAGAVSMLRAIVKLGRSSRPGPPR